MIAATYGEGTPLFLIHGFGVDHRILLPLEEALHGSHWRRIYLDLPWAEGAVDTAVANPRELADAVLAEVREVVGNGPFAILGNSFGAMIARHVAHELRAQCAGVATLAGAFELDGAKRTLPAQEIVLHDEQVLTQAGADRADFEAMAVIHTSEALRLFQEYALPGIRGAQEPVLERLSASYTDAHRPEHEHAEPFDAPALHILGRQDQVVGFEDGLAHRAHYPRGTFAVLDGAGHNLHFEQPAITGALLTSWLDAASAHTAVEK